MKIWRPVLTPALFLLMAVLLGSCSSASNDGVDTSDAAVDYMGQDQDDTALDTVEDTGSDTIADTVDADDTTEDALNDADSSDPDSGEDSMRQVTWSYVGVGNWGLRAWTADGQTWTDMGNPPQMDDHTPDLLRNVGFGNGVFIAVGGDQNSMIMRSTDGGQTWAEDLHPEGGQWLGGVGYHDGVWVAGGGVGTNMRSIDGGLTWTPNENRTGSAIREVGAANGKFVAVGDGGMIAVSSDAGLTWTEQNPGSIGLNSVAWGHNTWVVTGSSWNGDGFDVSCFTSPDTETWTTCPFTSGRIGGTAFGDGRLVVVLEDGCAVTENGSDWNTVTTEFPSSLDYGGGLWIGQSYQRRWAGTSLTEWTSVQNERGFRALAAGWYEE